MGRVSQIITVKDGRHLFFVTTSNDHFQECDVRGSNVWKFMEDSTLKVSNIFN